MANFNPNDPAMFANLFGLEQQLAQQPSGMGPVVPADMSPEALGLGPDPEPELPPIEIPELSPEEIREEAIIDALGEDILAGERPVQPGSRGESLSRSVSRGVVTSDPALLRKKGPRAREMRAIERSAAERAEADEEIFAESAEEGKAAEAALRDAEISASQGEQELLRRRAEFDAAEARNEAVIVEEANAEADERIAGIESAVQAVSTLRVDPSRIWSEGGAGNKAAGLVSAFIGGFLQPVLGTNTIQRTIDAAIDRDIDAQKANIGLAQKGVSNLRALHQLGLDQAKTESEQRDQDRMLREASLIGQLKADAQALQDPVLQAKYGKIINAYDDKHRAQIVARRKQAFDEAVSGKKQLHAERMAEQVLGQRRREHSFKVSEAAKRDERIAAAAAAEAAKAERESSLPLTSGFSMAGGKRLQITHEPTREKVRAQSAALSNEFNVASALELMPLERLKTPGSEARKRAAAMMAQLVTSQGEAIARSSDKDMEIFRDKAGGDPNVFFNLASEDTIKKVIGDLKANVKRKGTAIARSHTEQGVYDPIADESFLAEFREEIQPELQSTKDHASIILSPHLSPEEKVKAVETFLESAQNERAGLLVTPSDPNVRAIIEEYQKIPGEFKPRVLEGKEGREGRSVFLGRALDDELEAVFGLGSAKARRTQQALEAKEKREQEFQRMFQGQGLR